MRPANPIRSSYALGIAAATLAAHDFAFACSGPGAEEAILRAERLGLILWGVTLVVAVGSFFVPRLRAAGIRKQWPLLLLVVLHPGLWMSARSGDCGRTLVEGSILVAALAPLLAGLLFWRAARAAR
ncbi:hypothetical protein [Polyangium sp. 6x1]|uniref:hypothetical protein n=1 Tax=Polyangium sp. 6x1 TaxID=3042689 RepID=UPI002482F872|nr:hypothetical protein [Polyangium sp. 6x1]MDI1449046.1 hypothetical protein [Polyangium sp. 6x1]